MTAFSQSMNWPNGSKSRKQQSMGGAIAATICRHAYGLDPLSDGSRKPSGVGSENRVKRQKIISELAVSDAELQAGLNTRTAL